MKKNEVTNEKLDTDLLILLEIIYYFKIKGLTKKETYQKLGITEGKLNYLYYDKYLSNMEEKNKNTLNIEISDNLKCAL